MTSRRFAGFGALALVLTLTGCVPAGVADPRCAERAPGVMPPTAPRIAPPGWPAPPQGDTVCGTESYNQGEYGSSMESLIVVTDLPLGDVLDHYEERMPAQLQAVRSGEGDDERLSSRLPVDQASFTITGAGEGRYRLSFTTYARDPD